MDCFTRSARAAAIVSLAAATCLGQINVVEEIAPKIKQHPAGLTVEQGQSATLSVVIEADGPGRNQGYLEPYYTYGSPTFQWMKDGTRVTGATSATLTIAHADVADGGVYSVVVTNKRGWVSSNPAALTVFVPVPATIVSQPNDVTVKAGQPAAFEVVAVGTPAPTFRWRKNGAFIPGATGARFSIEAAQVDQAGSYDVLVSNSRNSVFSRMVALRVAADSGYGATEPPTLTLQPIGANLDAGGSFTLAVDATGAQLAFQWKKNGVPIPGATAPSLTLPAVAPTDMGFYSAIVSNGGSAVESDLAIVTVASAAISRLVNLSTRAYVPGGGTLTPGFTLRGSGVAQLLVRAIGPGLSRFGVTGILTDPTLELIPSEAATALLTNRDWAESTHRLAIVETSAAVGAFPLDPLVKDAAVVASLPCASTQSYTARIRASASTTGGVVLAEVYDATAGEANVRLAGVSTLGLAADGDCAMVTGFTIQGSAPKRLLVRAVGPTLERFGVADVLRDPQLVLQRAGLTQAVVRNDNWFGSANLVNATASAGAFPLINASKDAAVVVTLPPGGYTVTVSGTGGTSGTALVEIYDLDP